MQKNIFSFICMAGVICVSMIGTSVSATDGLFGTYFDRMVGPGPCSTAQVLTGFDATLGTFGTRTCKSLQDLMREQYAGQVAPTGQAMLGFDAVGGIRFGDVNWSRNGSNVSYLAGNIGIGTANPNARLEVSGGDAIINGITVGRGGGGLSNNVAVGLSALQSNSSSSNTAIGTYSLRANTSGSQNTALGTYSMLYTTTGENNIAMGSNSLSSNTSGGWNNALGSAALYGNTAGNWNTAVGAQALYNNSIGGFNIGIGHFAGGNITSGSNNLAFGYYALVPSGVASNQIRMGNVNVTYAGIQVPWTITSDRTLKGNILDTPLGLDFIRELNPVMYIRKGDIDKKTEFGFIAQDVEAILEKDNIKNTGMIATDSQGIKSLRYNDFFAPIVQSLKEVANSLDILTDEVRLQNTEIEALKIRLEHLEKNSIQ